MSENTVNSTGKKKYESQKRAKQRYDKDNLKYFSLCVKLPLYSLLEKILSENSAYKNRNEFIISAIKEKIVRDGLATQEEIDNL